MNLFQPGNIANLQIKNRIVMAPMCMYQADNKGHSSPMHLAHYLNRAFGQVGLIIQEATAVESRGRISANDLGIWSDDHVEGLRSIVDAVHHFGSKIAIQLAHAGRKCLAEGEDVVSPSNVPFSSKYPTPRELKKEEIEEIVNAFAQGAKRASIAGYDMVEIHGAHGYLINQFLSPLANHRSDEFGGPKENRIRFLKLVISAVKQNFKGVIGLRISAEEYAEGGNHLSDMLWFVEQVKNDLDIINVSSGGVVSVSFDVFPGYQLAFAKAVRNLGIPVIGGGLVTSEEMIEKALDEDCDFVYLGRELLRNPYFLLEIAKKRKLESAFKPYERAFI